MIVEDDLDIQGFLVAALENLGYLPHVYSNGIDALKGFTICQPDLILLDVQLPGKDGFEVCEEIRKTSNVPIIFVSCLADGSDIIRGLELGGDDYVRKPFDLNELIARIQSNLRRSPLFYQQYINNSQTNMQAELETLTTGPFRFHVLSSKAFIGDTMLGLSTKEFQILFFLVQHSEQTFHPSELYKLIWEEDSLGKTQALKVHISNLRKKLESTPGHSAEISTVRGFGYRLVLNEISPKR